VTPALRRRILDLPIIAWLNARDFIARVIHRARHRRSRIRPGELSTWRIIHFTEGATDPFLNFRTRGARFVPLADGFGDAHVSCLHLKAGGRIPKLPLSQASAFLLVHGHLALASPKGRLELSPGVGLVVDSGGHCSLESPEGAIVILVQAPHLEATECGISTPSRIRSARWPGEALPGRPAGQEERISRN
jgi:hypothetical protein